MRYELNPEQKRAVEYGQGAVLIVAGAGTGKTTVITQRVAWIIENKLAASDEILGVTFTEKAATEMEERLDKILPYGYVDLWILTFHAFCQRILESYGIEIGLPTTFRLFDQTQQWILAYNNFDRFELDYYKPLGHPTKFIHALLSHFSRLKDEAITPEEYLAYAENLRLNSDSSHFVSQILSEDEQRELSKKEMKELAAQEIQKITEVANAYHTYQRLLHENDALDFGDLINFCLQLFKKRPRVLAKYRRQFKYILVDEFQDTNWAQYELIKTLAYAKNNLTVVCCDDQSIYKFRGASVSNILQFQKDYADATFISLTKNYRSCQNILDLSYKLIQNNNPNRLEVSLKGVKNFSKKLLAQKSGAAIIEHIEAETLEDEMKAVITKIVKLKEKDKETQWSDFAILVRANSHADIFNYGLAQANIPFQYLASRGLYNKPIVMDIMCWLKLLDNYHESPALFRVLNIPVFGFSPRELVHFNYWAKRKGRSLYYTLFNASTLKNTNESTVKKAQKFIHLVEKHTKELNHRNVKEAVLAFLEDSKYLEHITKVESEETIRTISYLNQFYKKITDFEANSKDMSVRQFLHLYDLEVQAGETGAMTTDEEEGPDTVKLMTVHAAKGLEFKYVFIVNVVERRFPSAERREPIEVPDALVKEILPSGDVHLQEERRLFYVACTRAKDGLFFTRARDYGGSRKKKPSIFLQEVGVDAVPKMSNNIHGVSTSASVKDLWRSPQIFDRDKESAKKFFKPPERFSYSELRSYAKCPWQYRYAFVLRVPVKGKAAFSFGNTMHAALQKTYQHIQNQEEARQGDLFGGLKKQAKLFKDYIDLQQILMFYEACFIDDWYEDDRQREGYYKKGKEILKRYYQDVKDTIVKPLHLEKNFSVKLIDPEKKKQYSLYGRFDRIDKMDGGLAIIDYKTGQAKSKLRSEDKEQLLIYQLAAQELFDEKVNSLTFHFLDDNIKQSFLGGEKDLDSIKKKFLKVIHKIEKGEFSPTPGMVCRTCDFNGICPYRKL